MSDEARRLSDEDVERIAEAVARKLQERRGSRAKPSKKGQKAERKRRAEERAAWYARRHGHYPPRNGKGT